MPPASKGPHLVTRNGWFHIAWTEPGGRSRRKPTRTRDLRTAQLILAGVLGDPDQAADTQLRLSTALAVYRRDVNSTPTTDYAIARIKEHFGDPTIGELTPETLRGYYTSARTVAETSKARELTVMRAALHHATREGLLDKAPFVPGRSPAPPRDRWLTREEARRLHRVAAAPHLRLFIELALATCARSRALFDLTWPQLDLPGAKIDLNPPGRQQTAKRRPVVPITPELVQSLLAARITARARHQKPVWVLEYGGKRIFSIKKAFARAARRAKLADVTPHTLRHTGATWMAQAGVPIIMISGMLGQSIQRTTELYIKHHPDHMREASEALRFRANLERNPPEKGVKLRVIRGGKSAKSKGLRGRARP